nr:Ig-like domain-containing protein [Micromonospora sp. DSM 115978]
MVLRRRRVLMVAAVTSGSLLLTSCTSERRAARPAPPPPPTLSVAPGTDAKDVPLSAEIATTVTGGRITAVKVTDDRGGQVTGEMRPDGSSWVPAAPLKPKRTYTAEVVATSDSGHDSTQSTRFTTMDKPQQRTASTLYLESGRTYGVAMPVSLSFAEEIPPAARDDVQRRLFVTTDPPQPGVWAWTENGRQVSYRAPDFWQPGTTISVRAALDGLPIGGKSHGDADRKATARIGGKQTLEIDNRTKQMSVFRDDRLIRKIPVSLGKPSTPTSSGKMVIMEKHDSTVFDTRGDPDGGYVVTVSDAQRLTWGGEFIHSAPWSVGDQGNRNVSHGCTNVSAENASWLMDVTQVGDLVTVSGTEVTLDSGNGWTVWNESWSEYVKGSALPVPAGLAPKPDPTVPAGAAPAGTGSPAPSIGPDSAPSTGQGG